MGEIDWHIFLSILIFWILGLWKAKELIDTYAPKLAEWIISKIEGRQR